MSCNLEAFNLKLARADALAEEEYWNKLREEDNKRYKRCEESELRKNAKNTCTFCYEFGHVVFQMGVLTCPQIKQTFCSACGLLGHTSQVCIFLSENEEAIRDFVQTYLENPDSGWTNKISQNLTPQSKRQIVEDCIRKCKQNINRRK